MSATAGSTPGANDKKAVSANSEGEKSDTDVKSDYKDYVGEPKEFDTSFTYPTHTDPQRQLPKTSLYLDDVERENAETQRAKIEGRKPDYAKPGSYQGSPLVPTHVVQAGLAGDLASNVVVDVTLPVVAGTPESEAEATKVDAVPFYQVKKTDVDDQGKVTV